ncbi:hypothetical protein PC129_g15849 [Phytophthora cactorum]|nr:hypothetical protein Pcac1_g25696 [Phytophthora cactorum]KAG2806779.1 hypothetical protein PC112_g17703 [Phytophthora cactorum]KAG2886320.1 hypothetical protein PC114_g19314 [Phytophthora cactorum]KAG2912765.1 hypothetical protein PC117_g18801 [Phytophthora cactorum]KAG2989017.1 hypothetical protein PC120_g23254 [Phytophthora cactorum]
MVYLLEAPPTGRPVVGTIMARSLPEHNKAADALANDAMDRMATVQVYPLAELPVDRRWRDVFKHATSDVVHGTTHNLLEGPSGPPEGTV